MDGGGAEDAVAEVGGDSGASLCGVQSEMEGGHCQNSVRAGVSAFLLLFAEDATTCRGASRIDRRPSRGARRCAATLLKHVSDVLTGENELGVMNGGGCTCVRSSMTGSEASPH